MDLRHLQTLVALAEELHYGRAARRLHVVQSAVSRTIQDLEEEVGAQLFHRTKRRVELTAAGEVLVRRAREILDAADRAAAECRRVSEGKLGRLRIAVAGLSGLGHLPEALRAFRRKYPDVEIEIGHMGTAAQIEALGGGRIELAFTHVPLDDDAIVAEPLRTEALCAMLPADHAMAGAKSVPAERLLHAVVAIPSRSSAPEVFRALAAHAASQGVPMPRVIEVEDISLMMTLVAAGLAISHLPEGEARIGYRGVVAIPVEPAYTTTLFGVQRKDPRSPLAEALLAEMRGR
jgi:DNA-binding transcriptional LysR family regulator